MVKSSLKKTLVVLCISLVVAAAFYAGYYFANTKPVTVSTATQTSIDVSDTYNAMNSGLLKSITEKDFVAFAQNTIEKKCPFYKPDGVTYRQCLSDWEQDLESKNLSEQTDEVHAYCSTFTKKYVDEESLEGQELFLKCAIFKLQ